MFKGHVIGIDSVSGQIIYLFASGHLTKKEELLSIPWVSGSIWQAAFYRQIDELVDSIINDSNYCGALFEDGLKTRKVIDQFLMEKS